MEPSPALPPPSPRRRLPAAERRERILDAADELFGAESYPAVSMARVAAAAGVTNPVVYDHFASKRELYVQLLGRQAQRLVQATTRTPPAATLEGVLRDNVEAFFAFVEAHPGAWRMLFRDAPTDVEIAAAHDAIQAAATAALAGSIVAHAGPLALSADLPGEVAGEMLAELGKSALNGLARWWWGHPEVPRDAVAAVAFDLLWRGVAQLAGLPSEDVA